MPTAIVRTYTPDGFVVAADGRACNSVTKTVIRDELQEIYRCGNGALSFSFLGAAHLGRADRDDTDERLFDFIEAFVRAAQTISGARYRTLQEYAARMTTVVNRKLDETVRRGNIVLPAIASADPSDRGDTIVVISVDGYHAGLPARARIRFCHENQQLLPPEITTEPLTANMPIAHGIAEIGNRIISGDPSLSDYMQAIELDDLLSSDLATAIQFSRAFIAACAGPEGAEIDPEVSASIGGRIHIATITPAEGFRWVPGFEPTSQQ